MNSGVIMGRVAEGPRDVSVPGTPLAEFVLARDWTGSKRSGTDFFHVSAAYEAARRVMEVVKAGAVVVVQYQLTQPRNWRGAASGKVVLYATEIVLEGVKSAAKGIKP